MVNKTITLVNDGQTGSLELKASGKRAFDEEGHRTEGQCSRGEGQCVKLHCQRIAGIIFEVVVEASRWKPGNNLKELVA